MLYRNDVYTIQYNTMQCNAIQYNTIHNIHIFPYEYDWIPTSHKHPMFTVMLRSRAALRNPKRKSCSCRLVLGGLVTLRRNPIALLWKIPVGWSQVESPSPEDVPAVVFGGSSFQGLDLHGPGWPCLLQTAHQTVVKNIILLVNLVLVSDQVAPAFLEMSCDWCYSYVCPRSKNPFSFVKAQFWSLHRYPLLVDKKTACQFQRCFVFARESWLILRKDLKPATRHSIYPCY